MYRSSVFQVPSAPPIVPRSSKDDKSISGVDVQTLPAAYLDTIVQPLNDILRRRERERERERARFSVSDLSISGISGQFHTQQTTDKASQVTMVYKTARPGRPPFTVSDR